MWEHRGLARLLVVRDMRLRYKRSLFGVWWTLLSPLLEMAVLAAVFSQLFRFSSPDAPYVVYLLSGIIVANLMRAVVLRTTGALGENAHVLARMRLPPEIFPVAAALEALMTFFISLLPLAVIMLVAGTTPSPTAPLLVVPVLLIVVFALGIGLALAPIAARFTDIFGLTAIALTLGIYLAPVFYPYEVVPERWRFLVDANPLHHALRLVRDTLYGDSAGALSDYLIVGAWAFGALAVGSWVFGRRHRAVVAFL
jgi:ABC-type polysaccharide/polyol phosphate export permease